MRQTTKLHFLGEGRGEREFNRIQEGADSPAWGPENGLGSVHNSAANYFCCLCLLFIPSNDVSRVACAFWRCSVRKITPSQKLMKIARQQIECSQCAIKQCSKLQADARNTLRRTPTNNESTTQQLTLPPPKKEITSSQQRNESVNINFVEKFQLRKRISTARLHAETRAQNAMPPTNNCNRNDRR